MSEPGTDYVKVPGASLRVVVEGEGVPVLVLGSSVFYPRTFSPRLRKSCRMAYLDLRHFAKADTSFGEAHISLDTYMDDVEQARASLGFEEFVLMGHSHHGNLALEYARRQPDRISHLVMIGSPPCNVADTLQAAANYWIRHASETRKAILQHNRQRLGADERRSMSPEQAFIAQYVADAPLYWCDPHYDASALWQGVPVNMDALQVFRDFFADYSFNLDPSLTPAPVLITMGRHDYAVPHLLWDKHLSTMANLSYHLFEQSGHTPQLEEPEGFAHVFLDWLASTR